MLKGQVRAATRWITDHAPGSVLSPSDIDNGSGKNVFEDLKDKHPEPVVNDDKAYIECDELPLLIDVEATSGHIEKVARGLKGGAGLGGTTGGMWQDFLLCQSSRLEMLLLI